MIKKLNLIIEGGNPSINELLTLYLKSLCLQNGKAEVVIINGLKNFRTKSTNKVYTKQAVCPSQIDPKDPNEYRMMAGSNQEQGENLMAQIDGGDKAALLAALQNGTSQQKKTALLGESPYLSDDVLNATIDNGNLAATDLRDVIIANSKDATVAQPIADPNGEPPLANTEEVVANIDETVMPATLKYEVQLAQEGFSKKQELYAQAAYYLSKSQLNIDEYIRYYLTDSIDSIPNDSVIDILLTQSATHRQLQLANAYAAAENYPAAQGIWATFQNDASLTDYLYLQNLVVTLKQNNQTAFSLRGNATARATIKAIADDAANTGHMAARAIMHHVYGVDYPIELPDESNYRIAHNEKRKRVIEKPASQMQVLPNPFKEQTYVIVLLDEELDQHIELHDAFGKMIQHFELNKGVNKISINASDLTDGVYTVVRKAGNIIIDKQKIVCIK